MAAVSRVGADPAVIAWFNDVAGVVLNTSLPPAFVSRLAEQVARGLSPGAAMRQLLGTPQARLAVSEQSFQLLLGRGMTPAERNSPEFAGGLQARVLTRLAASGESFRNAGGDAAGYRSALSRDLLGGLPLPAALARLPVETTLQRQRLVGQLLRTPAFARAWTDRLAGMALAEGRFPAALLQSAARHLRQPDGFRIVFARLLATPQSRADVTSRALPDTPPPSANPISVGPVLPTYFDVSRQGLVPDPVTDPPAYNMGNPATSTSFGVPLQSPWGHGAVFPEVSYASIMTGKAAQPALTLPDSFAQTWSPGLDGGLTFQTWFQAKSPGALLSAALTIDAATTTTQVPLLYINSLGRVVAGLFDGTPLTPIAGQTVFSWTTSTGATGGDPTTSGYQVGAANPIISQASVVDNTWHHVALVVQNHVGQGQVSYGQEALYLDGLLVGQVQTPAGSIYSFTPTLASGQATGPSTFTVGGTTIPESIQTPYPQINYPQGFIGTIDEVAAWTVPLSQSQVQAAMTAPVASNPGLKPGLVDEFDFDQPPTKGDWPNQISGGGSATGPALVRVPTTIPTDPFTSLRPPGARAWGIQVMMPLAAPSVVVGSSPEVRQVALAAGDQIEISVPDANKGTLTFQAKSDLGVTVSGSLVGGGVQYLVAKRTGSLELTLTWTPNPVNGSPAATVTLSNIPGPLNSLMGVLTSFQQGASGEELYSYAYAAPGIPTINPDAGSNPGDTAAGSYWPLWTDTHYFPVPSGTDPTTWATSLSNAYSAIVAHSSLSTVGFANLIGVPFANNDIIGSLEAALDGGYTQVYGSLPTLPLTPPGRPFQYQPESPQQAVYYVFYVANQMRRQVASVLNGTEAGTVPGWLNLVISKVGTNQTPTLIKDQIETSIYGQVKDVKIQVPDASPPAWQLFAEAGLAGIAAFLGGIIGDPGSGLAVAAATVAAVGASVGNDFIGQAGVPGYENVTVPFTPITDALLATTSLDTLAANAQQAAASQWQNSASAFQSTTFVESFLSNFGLLEALQAISGSQLTVSPISQKTNVSPDDAATDMLARLSWSTMIPGVYRWSADAQPYDWPAADGRTTLLNAREISLGGPDGAWDVVAGHFITRVNGNPDNNLDLAVTDRRDSVVTILQGNGDGTFTVVDRYQTLKGPDGPQGLAVGQFRGQDTPSDLVVAANGSSDVSVLLSNGDGTFKVQPYSLKGPDGAWDVVVGDFYQAGVQSFAVTSNRSGAVSFMMGDGQGNFSLKQTLRGLSDPRGIVYGNFDGAGGNELAVAEHGNGDIAILRQDGNQNYYVAARILVNGTAGELVAADFNADGLLDLAATDDSSNYGVHVLYNRGGGQFQDNFLDIDFGVPYGGIAVAHRAGSVFPDLIVPVQSTNNSISPDGVLVYYNQGGSFAGPSIYALGSTAQPIGVVAADFANVGSDMFVVARHGNDDLVAFSGATVGNFAGYQPGGSAGNVATVLANLQALQGGNDVRIGPIDDTGQITPGTSSPPFYLGYIGLIAPYSPAPLDVSYPGNFLTAMPAFMQQSSLGYSYQSTGTILTPWRLVDLNGNPISPAITQAAFGVPAAAGPNADPQTYSGTNLAPIDPARPFAALNGGWYFAQKAPAGAYGTLADAFFNWGRGIKNYSTRVPIPNLIPALGTGTVSGTLPGTSYAWTYDNPFNYTITYTPATTAPPALGTAVDLTRHFNVKGIVGDGTTFTDGMGGGYAFSAQSLPRVVVWNNVRLELKSPGYVYGQRGTSGATNVANAIGQAGLVIPLPAGAYGTLTFLGSGVFGAQANQQFTVAFSDGSTQTYTQSMSDWFHSAGFAGETVVAQPSYVDRADGTTLSGTFGLYGYSFALPTGKTAVSITLPNNNNIRIMAMTLS